jgi:hypothetical protein
LQQTIDEVLAELSDPSSELAQQASGEGLDPAQLGAATVTVEETEQGIAPLVAAIVVGIVVEAGKDGMIVAWKKIIAPQIEKRRGGLALGEQLPGEGAADAQAGDGRGDNSAA